MPAAFPLLSSGYLCHYPVIRRRTFKTTTISFGDGSEQRWASRRALADFSLAFLNASRADMVRLRDFFVSMKGAYDHSWSLTVDGITYPNCAFEDDRFPVAVEQKPNRWSGTFKIRQTLPSLANPAMLVNPSFPKIIEGAWVTQRPYTEAPEFITSKIDLDCGERISGYELGTPTWYIEVNYPCIDHDEAADVESFFDSMAGRLRAFSFTDDSGIVHLNCHFGVDEIAVTYVAPGQYSIKLPIVEFA